MDPKQRCTGRLGKGPSNSYDEAVELFKVVGGGRLVGEVRVTGAKNSVLKLMAAALLAEGTTTLLDVPDRRLPRSVDFDRGDLGASCS